MAQQILLSDQIKSKPIRIKKEINECVKYTNNLDENGLIVLISRVLSVLKPGNRRNVRSEQILIDDFFKGMYWKRTKQKWVAEWDSSKRSTRVWKTFSVSRYGNAKAKQLAARARIEAELRGETSNNPEPLINFGLVEDLAQIILLSSNMDEIEKEEIYDYLVQKKHNCPIITTFLNSSLFHTSTYSPISPEQFDTHYQGQTSTINTSSQHTPIETLKLVTDLQTNCEGTHCTEQCLKFSPVQKKLKRLRNIFEKNPTKPKSPTHKKIRKNKNKISSTHTSPTLCPSDHNSNFSWSSISDTASRLDEQSNFSSENGFDGYATENLLDTNTQQNNQNDHNLHNPPPIILLAKMISYVSSKLYNFRTDIQHYLLAIQTLIKKGILPKHKDFIKEVIEHAKFIKNNSKTKKKSSISTNTYDLSKLGWLAKVC